LLNVGGPLAPTPTPIPDDAPPGFRLAEAQGCLACHTTDGTALIGPTWKGLFGKTESLEGGGSVTVDAAYLKESINDPSAKVVDGYLNLMPALALSQDDVEAIIVYIQSLE
jgi:cytochrome c oxidase subunit 2